MSTIVGLKSVEMTRPPSPTIGAAASPVSPNPDASSRIVSPGLGASSRSTHSRTGVEVCSIASRHFSHPGAIVSQVSYAAWRYSSVFIRRS